MAQYRGGAAGQDRAKAVAAVLAVHAALAAALLTGLNVDVVTRAVERLQTVDIRLPPPPEPSPPTRPAAKPAEAPRPAGAPAPKSEASPIVAPTPKIPMPSPMIAAKVAGQGNAPTSGAGLAGTGTGAGGTGSGPGGGGPDYSRFTPAQLIRNLSRADYRALAGGRMPAGRAMVSLRVDTRGTVSSCRVIRSSGDTVVDLGLCPIVADRLRFRPALDDRGRPIPYGLDYVATWRN